MIFIIFIDTEELDEYKLWQFVDVEGKKGGAVLLHSKMYRSASCFYNRAF